MVPSVGPEKFCQGCSWRGRVKRVGGWGGGGGGGGDEQRGYG